MDAITVRLMGGLGNQLFTYSAGLSLAKRLDTSLRVDVSRVRRGFTDHGVGILDFDLPGQWLGFNTRSDLLSTWSLPGRVTSRLFWTIPALRSRARIYDSPETGFDPTLGQLPRGSRVHGYFQSWRHVEAAGLEQPLKLRRPSPWLLEAARTARTDLPIAVHVRRGDYLEIPEFGCLSREYYKRSIEMLRDLGHHGPVWLFSDDPSEATKLVEGRLMQASPAEEMLAMSLASANVIANSTFSWWGAWLNENSGPVIAPEPWFRDHSEISDLLPPWWTRISAHWER